MTEQESLYKDLIYLLPKVDFVGVHKPFQIRLDLYDVRETSLWFLGHYMFKSFKPTEAIEFLRLLYEKVSPDPLVWKPVLFPAHIQGIVMEEAGGIFAIRHLEYEDRPYLLLNGEGIDTKPDEDLKSLAEQIQEALLEPWDF